VKAPLLALVCAAMLSAQAPLYTPSSIVNSASFKAGSLAPNTIATVYGKNLAHNTKAVSQEDLYQGTLPTTLLGTGVRLTLDGVLVNLYYVSPGQINFLVPANFTPGKSHLLLALDGKAGQRVGIELKQFSPALFQLDPETVLATKLNASVVTPQNPARAGDYVILYATGLGETRPKIAPGQIPKTAAVLANMAAFGVFLNGEPVDRANILYAGLAPGFAGLYQINLKLPDNAPRNPEIRIGFNDILSPTDVRLPLQPGNPE
jgi:uncharacterized protein (TIGR03437 family)